MKYYQYCLIPILFLQSTQREMPSLLVPDSENEFWDRSIVTLLKDVHGFRTRVGQLFAKVGGSGRPKPLFQVCLASMTDKQQLSLIIA